MIVKSTHLPTPQKIVIYKPKMSERIKSKSTNSEVVSNAKMRTGCEW